MKIPKQVEHWDDERDAGNGVIITIKSGYRWGSEDHGTHVRGFDTPQEAKKEIRYVTRCNCKLCDDGQ